MSLRGQSQTVLLMKYGNVVGLEYLKLFLDRGHRLAAVIFQGDIFDPKDRWIVEERTRGRYKPLSLGEAIGENKVDLYFVKGHNSPECQSLLERLSLDIALVGGTDILGENLLKTARKGFLNCHPGILPDYRGCSCVEWAIYNDDKVGATCHVVTPKIDRGPVVYAEELSIRLGESYEEVRARMIPHLARVMLKGYEKFCRADWTAGENGSEGKYYKIIGSDKLKVVVEKLERKTYKHLVSPAQ